MSKKSPKINFKKIIIFLASTNFLLVTLVLLTQQVQKSQKLESRAVIQNLPSLKKGVAGGATPETFPQIKVSWFYNWGYTPGYNQESGLNNWDPEIWQKFVPLFTIKGWQAVASQMETICSQTNYCQGSYYLIGNEPMVKGQDYIDGYSEDEMASFSAEKIGLISQAIRKKDPKAQLIILGLASPSRTGFVVKFIQKWKEKWSGTEIANLAQVIKGWHVHIFPPYQYCPQTDQNLVDFSQTVNQTMQQHFEMNISNQEIWVTEMGSLDRLPAVSFGEHVNNLKNLMTCLVNVYENSSLVTRYAWFYHGCLYPQIHSYRGCDNLKWMRYNLFFPYNDSLVISELGQKYASLAIVPRPVPTSTLTPTPPLTPTPTHTTTNTPIPTATPTPKPKRGNLIFKIKFPGVTGGGKKAQVRVSLIKNGEERAETIVVRSNSEGVFEGEMVNIEPDVYDVYLKGWAHLQKKFESVTLNSGENMVDWTAFPLLAGDANGDNLINIQDFGVLVRDYLKTESPADFNLDSMVNIQDFRFIVENYLKDGDK